MKNQELDTSWFDLKNYEGLTELTLNDWLENLKIRSYAMEGVFFTSIDFFKTTPVLQGLPCDFLTRAVYNTSFLTVWWHIQYFGKYGYYDSMGKIIEKKADGIEITQEEETLMETPVDHIFSPPASKQHYNYLTVDLRATDQQIMEDFSHWLAECRKVAALDSRKKKFTQKDLMDWVTYRVLPYIDLMIIAKQEQKKITQARLANLIFPNELNTDVVERQSLKQTFYCKNLLLT